MIFIINEDNEGWPLAEGNLKINEMNDLRMLSVFYENRSELIELKIEQILFPWRSIIFGFFCNFHFFVLFRFSVLISLSKTVKLTLHFYFLLTSLSDLSFPDLIVVFSYGSQSIT